MLGKVTQIILVGEGEGGGSMDLAAITVPDKVIGRG